MIERKGELRVQQIDNANKMSLQPFLHESVLASSRLMTDEWQGYRGLEARFKYHVINHGRG